MEVLQMRSGAGGSAVGGALDANVSAALAELQLKESSSAQNPLLTAQKEEGKGGIPLTAAGIAAAEAAAARRSRELGEGLYESPDEGVDALGHLERAPSLNVSFVNDS
jgi:hypothetical protein